MKYISSVSLQEISKARNWNCIDFARFFCLSLDVFISMNDASITKCNELIRFLRIVEIFGEREWRDASDARASVISSIDFGVTMKNTAQTVEIWDIFLETTEMKDFHFRWVISWTICLSFFHRMRAALSKNGLVEWKCMQLGQHLTSDSFSFGMTDEIRRLFALAMVPFSVAGICFEFARIRQKNSSLQSLFVKWNAVEYRFLFSFPIYRLMQIVYLRFFSPRSLMLFWVLGIRTGKLDTFFLLSRETLSSLR